jgi:CTP:molybdopterin cytidylyltransferase MocA
MSDVHILIPAAGASARMRGRDKLLEMVDGMPQLRRAVEAARGAGAARVWVTLPPRDGRLAEARHQALDGSWARRIEVPDCAEGMAASLRAGARAAMAQKAGAVLVLLADMPEIEAADLARFVAAFADDPDVIWRGADQDGAPGHPVMIPARLLPAMTKLAGDAGARVLLRGERIGLLTLPGTRATTDLDSPEDWAEWRARNRS